MTMTDDAPRATDLSTTDGPAVPFADFGLPASML